MTHAGENQIIPEARIQDENSATRENSSQSENSAKSENSAQSENSAKTENSAPIASGKISVKKSFFYIFTKKISKN